MFSLGAKKSRPPKSVGGEMKLDRRAPEQSPAMFRYVQQRSAVVQIDTWKQAATGPAGG
jgi:hypothetical protein